MKLRQLFEETPKPLTPGERRDIDISADNIEGLKKINAKISKLEDSAWTQSNMYVPREVKAEFEAIKQKTQEKLNTMYQRQLEAKAASEIDGIPKPIHNLIQKLEEECSDIMKVYRSNGQKFLYRGVKTGVDAFVGKPYEDRKSKDSDKVLSDLLNSALDEAGITARRDNSIFTSGNYAQASGYGHNVYAIFPKNGFSFSYSTKIKDFVFNWNEFKTRFMNHDEILEIYNAIMAIWDVARDYFYPNNYSFATYKDMGYLFNIKEDFDVVAKLIQEGKLDPKFSKFIDPAEFLNAETVVKTLGIKDDDIAAAIKSNHEVVVNSEYYAIKESKVPYLVQHLTNTKEDDGSFDPNGEEITKLINDGKKLGYIVNSELNDVLTAGNATKDQIADVITTISNLGIIIVETAPESSVKPEDDKPVKVGDKVQVTNGIYKGQTGTVSYFYQYSKMIDITLDHSDNSITVPPYDVKKIEPKSSDTVGNNDDDLIDLDTIDWDAEEEPKAPAKKAPPEDEFDLDWEPLEDPEPPKSNSGFKVGDNIVVTSDNKYKGKVGQITSFSNYNNVPTATVYMSNVGYISFYLTDLESKKPVTAPEVIAQMVDISKTQGYVTYDDLNTALDDTTNKDEKAEVIIDKLTDMNIDIVDTLTGYQPKPKPKAAKDMPLTNYEKSIKTKLQAKAKDPALVQRMLDKAFMDKTITSDQFQKLANNMQGQSYLIGKAFGEVGIKVVNS